METLTNQKFNIRYSTITIDDRTYHTLLRSNIKELNEPIDLTEQARLHEEEKGKALNSIKQTIPADAKDVILIQGSDDNLKQFNIAPYITDVDYCADKEFLYSRISYAISIPGYKLANRDDYNSPPEWIPE